MTCCNRSTRRGCWSTPCANGACRPPNCNWWSAPTWPWKVPRPCSPTCWKSPGSTRARSVRTWTTIPSTNCSLRWPRSSRKSRVPPAWPCVRGSRDWQCAPTRACCRGSCATCSATPAATPSAAACCWGRAGVAARYAWRCGTLAGASPPTSCRRSSSSSTNWTPGALPSAVASDSAGHRRPYRRHPRLPHRGAFDSRPRLAVRHRGAAGPQAGAASTRRGDCAGFGW